MPEESDWISLWKCSRVGLGQRHLASGYPEEDFPEDPQPYADGCAYFAKERWPAEAFVGRHSGVEGESGYEGWIIEVRVRREDYELHFKRFEQAITTQRRQTTELAIPRRYLSLLNKLGQRTSHRPSEE